MIAIVAQLSGAGYSLGKYLRVIVVIRRGGYNGEDYE